MGFYAWTLLLYFVSDINNAVMNILGAYLCFLKMNPRTRMLMQKAWVLPRSLWCGQATQEGCDSLLPGPREENAHQSRFSQNPGVQVCVLGRGRADLRLCTKR